MNCSSLTDSHSIDFPEFLTMMARQFKTLDTANDLLAAFKVFDPYHKVVLLGYTTYT